MGRPFHARNIVQAPSVSVVPWHQFAAGLTGTQDGVRTPGKIYGYAGGLSMWVGVINASSAWIDASTENGAGDGLIRVSIDGGAPYIAPRVGGQLRTEYVGSGHSIGQSQTGGRYELFRDEPQRDRLVCLTFDQSTYNIPFFFSGSGAVNSTTWASGGYAGATTPSIWGATTPAMRLSGYSPAVWSPVAWVQPGDGNALASSSAFRAAIPNPSSGYFPSLLPAAVYNVTGTNVPSVRLRAAARHMIIVAASNYLYVSIDGAAATRYAHGGSGDNPRARMITLDGAAHTYNVWQGNTSGNNAVFSVGVDAALIDIGDKRAGHQFGDSITAVAAGTSPGDADTMRAMAALGLVGSTFGISGETVGPIGPNQGLLTRIDALLAGMTVNVGDIAILAEGRNNVGGSWDSTLMGQYDSLIGKLLTKGYAKVLCRGILASVDYPTTTNGYPAENASIASVVAARADSRVVFIDVSGWPVTWNNSNGGAGIQLADGVHPTDAGYVTMTSYAVASYAPHI